MATVEKIVSPGVFTNEKDQSFLPSGIAAIGAAVIGPTPQGRAFVPTIVQNFDEYIALYGGLNEETYVPYTVESYLKAAGTVTVIRVLPDGGYNVDAPVHIIHSGSGTGFKLVGTIHPTTTVGSSTGKGFTKSDFSVFNGKSVTGSFGFQLSGSGVTAENLTASANPTSPDSFANVLSKSVKGSKKGYVYTWFSDFLSTQNSLSGSITFQSASAETFFNLSGSDGAWGPAYTPWIQTQKIGGDFQDLFRFATLADGTDTNTTVKVSIVNTVLPGVNPGTPYGSFTVVVRGYSDSDKRQNILETYSNVNLDPDSVDYIARRIGDRSFTVGTTGLVKLTGDYNNVSKYVRVIVSPEVASKTITTLARPYGFRALLQPAYNTTYNFPSASYVTATPQIDGFYNTRANYGWNFSSTDNGNYNKPIPSASNVGNNVAFNLDNCFIHPSASKGNSNSVFTGGQSISGSTFAGLDVANILKFNVPFQGGFDGMDPAISKKVGGDLDSTNTFGMAFVDNTSNGSVAYTKALNTIANGDEYDVNLVVMPGINANDHGAVVTKAIEVVEERGDAFAIIDPVKYGKSINETISAVQLSNIQSNYVAMYWPWVKIIDRNRNKPVWVPPSVVLPRVYANNDTVAYEWFAPAGLNRGGIRDAVDVESKLGQAERNDLYENRINPLASFPAQGICVWGQKTMQATPSALDRVNVRRLLISLKKFIASSARYLVFENNTAVTRQRFINIVTPYLETVKGRQGLYAFRVVMDETNNTPDVVDRNILYGQIYLQPAKAAEFVVLDFNVLRTGATFQNA